MRSVLVKLADDVHSLMVVKLLEDGVLRQKSAVLNGTLDTGSDIGGNSFVTVNMHYLDPRGATVKMCLGVIDLPGGFKGEEDINEKVKPLLRAFGISVNDKADRDPLNAKSDILFLVTDTGGADHCVARRLATYIGCGLHRLQLGIKHVSECDELKPVWKKIDSLCAVMNTSKIAKAQFFQLQNVRDMDPCNLIKHGATRSFPFVFYLSFSFSISMSLNSLLHIYINIYMYCTIHYTGNTAGLLQCCTVASLNSHVIRTVLL